MNENEIAIQYKINMLTDTGVNVTINLVEDVELEPLTQQQLMLDAIDNVVTDKEVKEQIKPFLEAILKSQTPDGHKHLSSDRHSDYYA